MLKEGFKTECKVTTSAPKVNSKFERWAAIGLENGRGKKGKCG
jgi:hypothetical protein